MDAPQGAMLTCEARLLGFVVTEAPCPVGGSSGSNNKKQITDEEYLPHAQRLWSALDGTFQRTVSVFFAFNFELE